MQLGISIGIPSTLGKVAAFSPLDLSPVLWLDASDTSTITESGGAVSQWDDKSGNGNDVTQGTAANQPTSGTRTLNGLNVLDFDGTTDFLTVSGFTASQPITLFAVVEKDTDTSRRIFTGGILGWILVNQQPTSYAGNYLYGTIGTAVDNTPHIMRHTFNGVSSSIHVDGTQTGPTGNAGTTGITSPFTLSTSSTQQWDGIIAEIIVIDGTLTADQITATESYLASKWGITL